MEDARALIASRLAPACLRVLIEVPDDGADAAVARAAAVDAELVSAGVAMASGG